MIVIKVCLFSVVLCVVWFGAVNCQRRGIPYWLASLWLPGGSRSDLNKMITIEHYGDSVHRRVLGGRCEMDEMEETVREVQRCLYANGIYWGIDDETEDIVNEYCSRMSHVMNCHMRMAIKMRLCLNTTEKLQLDNSLDAAQQLFGYLCDNQGKKLSQFFAEGGQVCFDKLTGPLIDCMNGTKFLNRYLDLYDVNPDLFEPIFEKKQCAAIKAMRDCTVETFRRHCDRPTPADMTATMMDILIKGTPCKDPVKPSAAAGVSGVHALVAVTAAVVLLLQPAP